MDQPIEIDLPHKLGREEAQRRIAANIDKLERHIPGGAALIEPRWSGDRLDLTVGALGQTVEAEIDVRETVVHCTVRLPAMLAMFARPIEAMLRARGPELLDDKRSS